MMCLNNVPARYEKIHGTEAFWGVVEQGGLKFWSEMSWNTEKVVEIHFSA